MYFLLVVNLLFTSYREYAECLGTPISHKRCRSIVLPLTCLLFRLCKFYFHWFTDVSRCRMTVTNTWTFRVLTFIDERNWVQRDSFSSRPNPAQQPHSFTHGEGHIHLYYFQDNHRSTLNCPPLTRRFR